MENRRTLDIYLRDIKDLPRISKEKEVELSKIIQHGCDIEATEKAIKEMVEGNVRLAVKYAFQYHKKYSNSLTEMDLIEEANVGLVKAARGYKSETGYRFSTYAVRSICSHMDRAIQNSKFVRIPVNHFKHLNNLRDLIQEHGENVADEFLMEELDVTPYMLKVLKGDLENKIDTYDEESSEVYYMDYNDNNPSKGIELEELREELMKSIDKLSPIEKDIIITKHFSEKYLTFEEIASNHGVSRQRTEQIYRNALNKLKRHMKNKKGDKKNEKNTEKKNHNRRTYKFTKNNNRDKKNEKK